MSSASRSSLKDGPELEERKGNDGTPYGETDSARSHSIEPYINEMQPQAIEDENPYQQSLHRQPSLLERVQSKYSFFNEKLSSQRKWLLIKFLTVYLTMAVLILAVFSIYWGSMYGRNNRLKNLRMLVVIEDDQTIDGVSPLIGESMRTIVQSDGAQRIGQWHVFGSDEFARLASKHGNNVEQELERQIHHQNYWSSIYVKPNATYNLYQAILQSNGDYNATNNSIVSVYETGRDFQAMGSYVTPSIQRVEKMWLAAQSNMTENLIQSLSNASDVLSNRNSLRLLSTPLSFVNFDRKPYNNPVILAPSQVGLIYLIIVTLFQINFFQETHIQVAGFNMKPPHFVLYRWITALISFLVLSLFYSLVSLAFQIDFQKAFGQSGFLVYWMISFLTMSVVGYMNEIMVMVLVPVYPPLIGFWMLFWVISNISPTFAPMALCPGFYRYGYAMPIHNSYEINKVILFDTYKGALGRHIGILVAWFVICSLVFPFALRFMGQRMKKKMAAAKQAQK